MKNKTPQEREYKCYLCKKELDNPFVLECADRQFDYLFCKKCSQKAGKAIRELKKHE